MSDHFSFDGFERRQRRFGQIFAVFFCLILATIIAVWSISGFIAYKAAMNPEATGNAIGRFLGSIQKGMEEGSR